MDFEELKKLYLEKKEQYGSEAYKYISQLLEEAKELHKKDWLKNPTKIGDHEQSWKLQPYGISQPKIMEIDHTVITNILG